MAITPFPQIIRIPPSARKRGAGLFDQQMWCLGRDIVHPQSNYLLAYGLTKHPSPHPRFHSFYSQALDGGHIHLWGWGIQTTLAGEGSLFLARGGFHPLYSQSDRLADVWCVQHMPPMRPPDNEHAAAVYRVLWAKVLHWLADYEAWLQRHHPPTYRAAVINAWPNRRYKPVSAEAMPHVWRDLAHIVANARAVSCQTRLATEREP